MNLQIVTLSTFAAVSLSTLGVLSLVWEVFFSRQSRMNDRVKQEFFDKLHDQAKHSALFRNLRNRSEDNLSLLQRLTNRLSTFIAQSGLKFHLRHFAVASLLTALLGAIAVWFACHSVLAIVPALLVGVSGPWWIVHFARKRRMQALCRQLPDAFDVMARALKSGQTVQATFQVVAKQFPNPIAEEFAYCSEQQHLGISYDMTLKDFARRTGFTETHLFATALIINREVGGRLAEVLGRLAETMRKRARFAMKVKALTGEGRMQATVLITLPLLALAALFVLNRDYAAVLFEQPKLLAIMASSQTLGAICIRKLIDLKY